jgi:hypothetical protein
MKVTLVVSGVHATIELVPAEIAPLFPLSGDDYDRSFLRSARPERRLCARGGPSGTPRPGRIFTIPNFRGCPARTECLAADSKIGCQRRTKP